MNEIDALIRRIILLERQCGLSSANMDRRAYLFFFSRWSAACRLLEAKQYQVILA